MTRTDSTARFSSSVQGETQVPPQAVFAAGELEELIERIINSGELGRSRVYGSLLKYLAGCSQSGASPKEIEIAIDVLGRDERFDVSRDSAVRVTIHQLRKKLDGYYEKYEQEASHRIVIPKGQYTLAAVARVPAASAIDQPEEVSETVPAGKPTDRFRMPLLLAAVILLTANLAWMMVESSRENDDQSASVIVAEHGLWSRLFDDEVPILLVTGDYYIFGELNENGNVARMVRDFNINSSADLDNAYDGEEAEGLYRDLDLSYIPEGAAFALTRIAPVLQSSGKRIQVTMMSDLSTSDLRSNHIVYIGYLSGLDKLTNAVFSASGLHIGRTYDELVNRTTGQLYSSDAGLPAEENFRDFGMVSRFPFSSETELLVIAGTRDAGLMQVAQAMSSDAALSELENALTGNGGGMQPQAFEALYEVNGFDRMNFNSNLIYTNELAAGRIWGADR